jgi:hypothetical protein
MVINELNLYCVKQANPANETVSEKSTMYGYTIYNVDHEWYLPQVHHLVNGEGFTLDPLNPEMRVRRTPVYPLFYGIHYLLFGEEKSFLVIRYTQLLLMALGGILLGLVVLNYTGNARWARTSTILYSFSPFIFVFAYHTITEGLTPLLVILPVYFASRFHREKKNRLLVYCGLCLALTLLNRPLTGILLPALLLSWLPQRPLLVSRVKSYFVQCTLVALAMVAGLLPWVVRNYFATGGELVVLEKYYYDDPMDFGAGHYYFREWISCWANPATVSAEQFSTQLRRNIAMGNIHNDSTIDAFLDAVPPYGYAGTSKEEVRSALLQLNACFAEKYALKKERASITRKELSLLPCEQQSRAAFYGIVQHFKKADPVRYYLITPLRMFREGIFQSNSLFFGSLNPVGRAFSTAQVIIKGCMFLLNVTLFLSALLVLLLKCDRGLKWLQVSIPVLLLLAMPYAFFRYMDARYLLPVYPFLYISLAGLVTALLTRSRNMVP